MAIPRHNELYGKVLKLLSDKKVYKTSELKEIVASQVDLTDEERNLYIPSGSEKIINNRVGWAVTSLKKAGLVESKKWGYVNITEIGLEEFNKNPNVTDDLLKNYPSYVEWMTSESKKKSKKKNPLTKEKNISNYDVSSNIIKTYLKENNLGNLSKPEHENMFKKFQNKFSPESLEKLDGLDLLNKMFLHDGDKNNLCYYLEFSNDFNAAGGIGGGAATKYTLFKSAKTKEWKSGYSRTIRVVDEKEAIDIGTKIRDALVNGAKYIKNAVLETVDDYKNLEDALNKIFENCLLKPTNNWIHKYYVLIFPEKFPIVHSDQMKKEILQEFLIMPEKGYYANDGQLYLLSKKSNIKPYSLYDNEIRELFSFDVNELEDYFDFYLEDFESDLKRNIIYFGAPGTGKSYNLNQDKEKIINDEKDYERVTFHPDYSYANFVGTYKPVPKDDSISYEYVPGPFMRSLVKALKSPEKPFLLIIEEINRSNVAAVFGDVFQLLDRDKNNESRYSIETTEDMRNYLKSELNEDYEKIKIPSNMFIWATMNSADQGVFPMDTAFKRRWDFKYFGINYNEELIKHIKVNLNNQEISWNDLRKAINNELLSYRINEDKLLGPFFAFNEYLDEELSDEEFKEIFKNKIIMYLFEDAAKAKRNDLFAGARENNNVIYSRVCELFDSKGIEIFCDNIKDTLLNADLESEIEEDFIEDVFEESE